MNITLENLDLRRAPSACTACGADLYAYATRCHVCGTPRDPAPAPDTAPAGPRLLRVGHLTDLHLTSEDATPATVLDAWVQAMDTLGVEQLVVSGDLVESALDERALVDVALILTRRYAGRFVVVPGNHDIAPRIHDSPFDRIFPGAWPRVEPRGPVDFILFDTTRGLPHAERTAFERVFARRYCFTEGRVSPESLAPLSAELRPDAIPVIVLHHHVGAQPSEPASPAMPWLPDTAVGMMRPVQGGDELLRWARKHRVRLILHGHKHRRHAWRHRDGVLVANGGSSTQKDDHGLYRAFVFDLHTHGVQMHVATLSV